MASGINLPMARRGLTRRQMLAGAAPVIAALPMAGIAAAPAFGGALPRPPRPTSTPPTATRR